MMIKIKGMINKHKGNDNLAKGKRIDKGNRKMLLIRQREWNKQKGNDEKQKGKDKTVKIIEKDHEN